MNSMLCNCFEDYFADYYCMALVTIAVSCTRFMSVRVLVLHVFTLHPDEIKFCFSCKTLKSGLEFSGAFFSYYVSHCYSELRI